ncbi:MAG: tryptophan 2,3-dioxygenase family protein [Chloroflexota bacterium]|nr:tryptophan 2,3-dioxygenase family protein [Chloroflexota bacterium]
MNEHSQPSLTYASYLHLAEILNAQHPVGPSDLDPGVQAAEHFFIVTHQVFELWFKQLLLDLGCASDLLPPPQADPEMALDHLRRAGSVMRLLVQQMVLFDNLSPRSFLAFRPYLGTASGSESAQWREVQKALGLRGQGGSAIYRAFLAALAANGLELDEVYRNPSRAGVLYRVAEALVDISEQFWQLCAVHVQVAERTIGRRPGTGGTTGVAYLAEGLESARAFPDLWAVRTRL